MQYLPASVTTPTCAVHSEAWFVGGAYLLSMGLFSICPSMGLILLILRFSLANVLPLNNLTAIEVPNTKNPIPPAICNTSPSWVSPFIIDDVFVNNCKAADVLFRDIELIHHQNKKFEFLQRGQRARYRLQVMRMLRRYTSRKPKL